MKRKFWLSILMTLMSVYVGGQTPRADSLQRVLQRDSTNYDVIMALMHELRGVDDQAVLLLAIRARRQALLEGDSARIVTSSRIVGQLYNRLTNVHLAIKELAAILPVAERLGLRKDIKMILNSLATAYISLGEYDKALDYNFRSLKLKQQDGDLEGVSVSLNNIGLVYYKIENYSRALSYWEQCLSVKNKINDRYDLDALYLNLARCFKDSKDFTKSQLYFEKVFETCGPSCRPMLVIHAENGLGELLVALGDVRAAQEHFKKSLELSKMESNIEYMLENLVALSKLSLSRNELVQVRTYLDELDRIEGKNQFPATSRFYYKLAGDYYRLVGDFQKASNFERGYSDLTDQLNDSDMHRKLMEIQIRFIEREHQEKLQNQRVLFEAQKSSLEKQETINILLGGIALLLVFLVIVYYRLNLRRAWINKRLDSLVRERTGELEENRLALQHAYHEQTIVLEKVARNLAETLATIKGLSAVVALEQRQDPPEYLKITEDKLTQLVDSTRKLSAVSYPLKIGPTI